MLALVGEAEHAHTMKEQGSREAVHPSTTVLDEIGTGLVLVNQSGEVGFTNRIADELLSLRVKTNTLLAVLIDRARLAAMDSSPDSSRLNDREDQRLIEAYNSAGARSVIGYRYVRSPTFGTIFTLRDITEIERFRAERSQLERLSQVGKACAMVAHEIGNPLAAIKATIQSIEPEARAAGLADPISAVYWEIDRLDKILAQLLGFVRHPTPRKVRTELPFVILKAKAATASRLKNVKFTTRYAALPPIYADPDQLQQVFINLFINAADAMPSGGTLAVEGNVEGGRIILRVVDDGIGIPAELREQVFESFYTTKPTGTGLGLSVCYRIVIDNGGTISVDGHEGRGTSILITFPFSRSA